MALALSKQVRREVMALGSAVADFASDVSRWRTFAAENTEAIGAWPKEPDGTLQGYGVTVTQLQAINALADDLAALGATHADTLALLKELN